MVDDNYGFCPHCGENVKSDAVYCPGCGAVLKQEAAQAQLYNAGATGKTPMRGMFLFAFVMLIIYTVLELISASSSLMFNEGMYDSFDKAFIDMFGMGFVDYMREYLGVVITKEEFISNMLTVGISGMISAFLAGASAILCYKRVKFKFAVGCCVLSAIVVMIGSALAPVVAGVATGIFNLVAGLIVAYMIFSSKRYFEN